MLVFYRKYIKDIGIILLFGPFIGLLLTKAENLPSKWLVFSLLIICGISFICMIPKREYFLLLSFFFLIPMRIKYHPIFIYEFDKAWPVDGLLIFLSDVIFYLLFALWIYHLITDPEEHLRFFPWISFPFLLILIIAIANSGRNLAPEIVYAAALGTVFKNWLIFLYVANNLKKPKMVYAVTAIIILTLVHPSVIGFVQYLKGDFLGLGFLGERTEAFEYFAGDQEGGFRVTGTRGSPNRFGAFIYMILTIVLALLFAPIKRKYKYILLPILALSGFTLLATYSRGAWTGFALAATIIVYWCMVRLNGRKVINLIIVLSIMATGFTSTVFLVKSIRDRLFLDDGGSSSIRVHMKTNCYNMIKNNPLLGVGFGNYTEASKYYDNTGVIGVSMEFPWPVHNEYLLIAAEQGIPALIIFIFLLMVNFFMLFRIGCSNKDPIIPFIGIGFLGSFVAWCFHHQYDFFWVTIQSEIWVYIGVIQAMYHITQNSGPHDYAS